MESITESKTRDWEVILLVGLSLLGLGTLFILGYLDTQIIEQVKDIPISIVSNTNTN